MVRGPLKFERETALQIVRTDRATAEQIDAQNVYWLGYCNGD